MSYKELRTTRASELYRLRKQTFSDRPGWDVVCRQGMESLRWTDIKAMPASRGSPAAGTGAMESPGRHSGRASYAIKIFQTRISAATYVQLNKKWLYLCRMATRVL